jgi:hypothetical protein
MIVMHTRLFRNKPNSCNKNTVCSSFNKHHFRQSVNGLSVANGTCCHALSTSDDDMKAQTEGVIENIVDLRKAINVSRTSHARPGHFL